MSVTVSGTAITFNDGSTLSSTSTFGAIGSIAIAAIATASNLLPNATIAGTSCYYPSTISNWTNSSSLFTQGNGGANPYTIYNNSITDALNANSIVQYSTGNIGAQPPGGHTALSGTWRVLSVVKSRVSVYYNCCGLNTTSTTYGQALIVRVS